MIKDEILKNPLFLSVYIFSVVDSHTTTINSMDKENLCKKTIGYIVSLTAALCLAGCASTGVITVGKDRYMISDSNSMYWDGGSVLKDIIKEGTEFCAKQNKQFEIINSGTNDARSGNIILRGQKVASAKIEFTCK